MPHVNPDILRWARETAGFSLEEAAVAATINAARGKSGSERLAELERGERAPRRPQLLKLAKAYRRSGHPSRPRRPRPGLSHPSGCAFSAP